MLAKKRISAAAVAPMPAKKSHKNVTGVDFENAVEAFIHEMDSTCTAAQTLRRLFDLSEDGVLRFDRAAPVTLAEFDAALADLPEYDLPRELRTVKAVRALLGQAVERAQAAAAAEDAKPLFITQKQFDAALAAMGAAIGVAAECFTETNFTRGKLIGALSRAANAASGPVALYLRLIVGAVSGQKTPPRVPESYQDRLYRNVHGTARPQ